MYILVILAGAAVSCLAEPLPLVLPQIDNGSCSVADLNQARVNIRSILRERDNIIVPQCACDRLGQWMKIAHLNMSDPNENCPANWNLISTPV